MPIPEKIPMLLDEYHVDRIGRSGDRQFFACVTGAFPEDYVFGNDWPAHKKWFAVLHLFDLDGNYLETKACCGGRSLDGEARAIAAAEATLQEFLKQIAPYRFCNIAIKPFSFEMDGIRFGLISGLYADNFVELIPNGLAFYEPWNGNYDT